MASMGWEKTGRRWRVFWHVTLRDGTVDKGSRSFEDKTQATKFKEHCEKNEKALKQAICVKQALLSDDSPAKIMIDRIVFSFDSG